MFRQRGTTLGSYYNEGVQANRPKNVLVSLTIIIKTFGCKNIYKTGEIHHHHHHHHHTACRILGLVTCSSPINSSEVFQGAVLGFVSHMIDI